MITRIKLIYYLAAAVLWLLTALTAAHAQVSATWAARYTNHAAGGAAGMAVRLDAAGDVYVGGYKDGGDSGMDLLVIKYDRNGQQLWETSYSSMGILRDWIYGDVFGDLAVDAAGNVYVTGSGRDQSDFATLKYDPDGNLSWVARYSCPGGDVMNSYAPIIAAVASNAVYVTGASIGSIDTGTDIATVKYDGDGHELWVARYTGYDRWWDIPAAIELDGAGNVLIAGHSYYRVGEEEASEIILLKYSPQGQLLWKGTYRAPEEVASTTASGLVLDTNGNAYVVGTISADHGLNPDYVTLKFSPAGKVLWAARYDGPAQSYDYGAGIALDGQTNVIVTGTSCGTRQLNEGDDPIEDFLTIKYDANGRPLWTARQAANAVNGYVNLVLDAQDNIYLTGISEDAYLTLKYDPSGNRTWMKRFADHPYYGAAPRDLVVDNIGSVFVTGIADGDAVTVKYAQDSAVGLPRISVPPASQTVAAGSTVTLSVAATGAEPLYYQWRCNGFNLTGATNSILVLSHILPGQAGEYSVEVSNALGSIASRDALVAVLQPVSPGAVDPSFHPVLANAPIATALAVQPDGKLLIGGMFTRANGFERCNVVRLLPDGNLDLGFAALTWEPQQDVRCITLQTDGRILVGGDFFRVGGQACQSIVRLNPDGTVDRSFNTARSGPTTQPGVVTAIATQPDGKILVGGRFMNFDGTGRNHFVRLLPDGQVDTSFNPKELELYEDDDFCALALQTDGKILIGGELRCDDWLVPGLARLQPDGTYDSSFTPSVHSMVQAIRLLPDGRILLGGRFGSPEPLVETITARLNPDGSRDSSYQPMATLGWTVCSMALEADGKLIVGGYNTLLATPPPVARLNADGSLDVTFDVGTGPDCWGTAVALQPDGQVIVGGAFTSFNGVSCSGLARLGNDIQADLRHPADLQAPSNSISMVEVTAYGSAWRRGTNWPTEPNPIPIDYVTRAAALWRGGECYQFDPGAPPPLCWVNCLSTGVVANPNLVKAEFALLAERVLSPWHLPGEPTTVSIRINPQRAAACAVEETTPPGWTVNNISPGGEWDAVNGRIKWGPFLDNAPRTLTYQVVPSTVAAPAATFAGTFSHDGTSVAIAGTTESRPACRLRLEARGHDGQLSFSFQGQAGAQFLIEVSNDLIHWNPLANVVNSAGRFDVGDPAAANTGARFYRARSAGQ